VHDGNRRKTIAFISCAPHQSRLFSFFKRALPADVKSTITNVNLLPLTVGFWAALLRILLAPGPHRQTAEPTITLDYRKYVVNRAAVFRPLDGTIEWLWRIVAATYIELFTRRFRKSPVDLLVVWGGFQLPVAAALVAARETGIRTLFCENGYLPKTIVMDPAGINAGNSLMGKPAEFYRDVAIEEARRKSLFDMPLVSRPLKGGRAASENIALPDAFVFLPLQVHDDSQILLYSPHFPDMEAVVRACARAVKDCNRRFATRLSLVVKEHPSDHGRIDYVHVYAEHPDVVFTKLANTQDLIGKSSAVVTVNSTVGIEAMIQLKPVIALGEAFYAVAGLVRRLDAGGDLAALIHEAIKTPSDRDLIEHFLYFLRYEYLVPLNRNDLAHTDPRPAVDKIMKAIA
jgi:capsular polysaccharide export protein